nr:unnamed protein product [Callosobruchus analis]
MSAATFDYICKAIEPECSHQVTNFCKPIPVEERLVITLRFLATGLTFRQLAFTFRISKSTVARIVIEVCLAIWKILKEKRMKFPTKEDFKSIAKVFENKGKFPHCIGCIDGKHIRLKRPKNSGSMYCI